MQSNPDNSLITFMARQLPSSNTPMSALLTEFLARRFTVDRLHFYAATIIIVSLLLMAASFITSKDGQTVFGTRLGGDFPAFYIAGQIANEHGANWAYDTGLHFQIYHQMFPKEPPAEALPYVNPPFLLPVFSVLAQLPYRIALAIWLLVSAALYFAGIRVTEAHCRNIPNHLRSAAVLLALSFAPFIIYCWAWGQLSALGTFFIAMAVHFEKKGKLLLSGCALSLCAYKPTFLLVILPMMLVTKRFRALVGMAVGGALLGLLSFVMVGWQGIANYLVLLENFRRWKATADTIFQTWLYVDIQSFFHPFLGNYPLFTVVKFASLAAGVALLLYVWLRVRDRSFVWAITITASILLNVYTPIYDCSLLAIPALLVADRLYAQGFLPLQFRVLVTALWLLPWASQALAHAVGIQLYTPAIAVFAVYLVVRSLNIGRCRQPLPLESFAAAHS